MRRRYNTKVEWNLTSGTPADNATAVVVTVAAQTNHYNHIGQFDAGYTVDPTSAATLIIAYYHNGVAKTWTVPIKSGGPHWWDKTGIIVGDINTAITCTLLASGAVGNYGYLNVHWA